MKKILSLVLALVLVCGLAVTAMAANANMSTDTTVVEPGETVTVTMSIDEALEAVTAIQFELSYDWDVLTYASGSAGQGVPSLTINSSKKSAVIKVNWIDLTGTGVDLAAGTIAVVSFTAKETTSVEKLALSLNAQIANGSGVTLVNSSVSTSVTVCPDHNPTETVVDGNCTTKGYTEVGCVNCGTTIVEGDYNTDNHGEIKHVEAKEASCFEEGNMEHWYCVDCGATWTDANLTQVSNQMNVKIAPTHAVEHVEAAEAGCDYDGNIEYWYCTECGSAWLDEYGWYPTNVLAVKTPATGHTVEHVAAVEPGCENEGNIEYWYCTVCGAAWLDEACTQVTNLMSVKLGVKHNLVHVEAKDPTCYEEGNIEYWYCSDCGYAWLDELCWYPTNLLSVILPVSHNIEHVEANECTCWEDGNIEYWYCTDCGFAWLDEYLHLNTNLMSVVLPYTGHTVEHVEAKDPTCTENGNIEYWYCTCCGYAWADEDCTLVTNLMSVKLGATGHVDEDEDEVCDVCEADLSNPKSGDVSIVVAAAAAVISMTGAVALPIAKKKFF